MSSLEETTGCRFKDGSLARLAFTHKSYSAERGTLGCNERLEFLGDSVLGLAAAHYLYQALPDCAEGTLAKLKSRLVSKPCLAEWARELNLGRHLLLGQGEDSSGGRERESILANALEAFIGALYLDGGFEPAYRFVAGQLAKESLCSQETDYKSALQEKIQKKHKAAPRYEITQTVGPDHDKTFSVSVRFKNETLGEGKGKNRKEAEQAAAQDALKKMPPGAVR